MIEQKAKNNTHTHTHKTNPNQSTNQPTKQTTVEHTHARTQIHIYITCMHHATSHYITKKHTQTCNTQTFKTHIHSKHSACTHTERKYEWNLKLASPLAPEQRTQFPAGPGPRPAFAQRWKADGSNPPGSPDEPTPRPSVAPGLLGTIDSPLSLAGMCPRWGDHSSGDIQRCI